MSGVSLSFFLLFGLIWSVEAERLQVAGGVDMAINDNCNVSITRDSAPAVQKQVENDSTGKVRITCFGTVK